VTAVEFRRLGGAPPPEREVLQVDGDGRFTLWRSIGSPAVGRFSGGVPDPAGLAALVAAVEGEQGTGRVEVPAGAPVEEVEVGGAVAAAEADLNPPGPWGPLLAACRRLTESLTDQPDAAVALVGVEAPGRWRLEHRGTGVLPLELDHAELLLTLWRDGQQAGTAGTGPLGAGRVEAGPGWTLELDVPGAPDPSGGILLARLELVGEDGGVLVPMSVQAEPVRG
jgi:hypothetical protein